MLTLPGILLLFLNTHSAAHSLSFAAATERNDSTDNTITEKLNDSTLRRLREPYKCVSPRKETIREPFKVKQVPRYLVPNIRPTLGNDDGTDIMVREDYPVGICRRVRKGGKVGQTTRKTNARVTTGKSTMAIVTTIKVTGAESEIAKSSRPASASTNSSLMAGETPETAKLSKPKTASDASGSLKSTDPIDTKLVSNVVNSSTTAPTKAKALNTKLPWLPSGIIHAGEKTQTNVTTRQYPGFVSMNTEHMPTEAEREDAELSAFEPTRTILSKSRLKSTKLEEQMLSPTVPTELGLGLPKSLLVPKKTCTNSILAIRPSFVETTSSVVSVNATEASVAHTSSFIPLKKSEDVPHLAFSSINSWYNSVNSFLDTAKPTDTRTEGVVATTEAGNAETPSKVAANKFGRGSTTTLAPPRVYGRREDVPKLTESSINSWHDYSNNFPQTANPTQNEHAAPTKASAYTAPSSNAAIRRARVLDLWGCKGSVVELKRLIPIRASDAGETEAEVKEDGKIEVEESKEQGIEEEGGVGMMPPLKDAEERSPNATVDEEPLEGPHLADIELLKTTDVPISEDDRFLPVDDGPSITDAEAPIADDEPSVADKSLDANPTTYGTGDLPPLELLSTTNSLASQEATITELPLFTEHPQTQHPFRSHYPTQITNSYIPALTNADDIQSRHMPTWTEPGPAYPSVPIVWDPECPVTSTSIPSDEKRLPIQVTVDRGCWNVLTPTQKTDSSAHGESSNEGDTLHNDASENDEATSSKDSEGGEKGAISGVWGKIHDPRIIWTVFLGWTLAGLEVFIGGWEFFRNVRGDWHVGRRFVGLFVTR